MTDGRTDTTSYRDATAHLKMGEKSPFHLCTRLHQQNKDKEVRQTHKGKGEDGEGKVGKDGKDRKEREEKRRRKEGKEGKERKGSKNKRKEMVTEDFEKHDDE